MMVNEGGGRRKKENWYVIIFKEYIEFLNKIELN